MTQPFKIRLGDIEIDAGITIPGLHEIKDSLHNLHRKLDQMGTTNEEVEAAIAGDTSAVEALGSRVKAVESVLTTKITALEAEIATQKANAVDSTAAEAALAHLKEVADAIDPAPAPEPEPTPAPTAPTKAVYTHSGEAPVGEAWSASGFETVPVPAVAEVPAVPPNAETGAVEVPAVPAVAEVPSELLYYFSGDTEAGTTNGADAEWVPFTGPVQPVA